MGEGSSREEGFFVDFRQAQTCVRCLGLIDVLVVFVYSSGLWNSIVNCRDVNR